MLTDPAINPMGPRHKDDYSVLRRISVSIQFQELHILNVA
jgi:hypothetical protein